jgi:hypothetical protein
MAPAATGSPFGALQLALDALKPAAPKAEPIVPIVEEPKALPEADDRIKFVVGADQDDECVRDKVRVLIREGYDRDQAVAIAYSMCGEKAIDDVDLQPTEEMAALAARGLELRDEYNRGGTEVGVARARDIKNRVNLSPETVQRMNSFFARHRVDLDATGARAGEDGYPTAGAIAWMLWGGDPSDPDGAGAGWAARKVEEIERESKRASEAAPVEHSEDYDKALRRVTEYKQIEAKYGDNADAVVQMQQQLASLHERQQAIGDVVKALGEAFGGE